jgi:hypothetical protein
MLTQTEAEVKPFSKIGVFIGKVNDKSIVFRGFLIIPRFVKFSQI